MTPRGASRSLDPREREEILTRLRRDADAIAAAFGLTYRELLRARSDARSFYGLCDSEGRIRIRLNHVTTGRALRYSSLVNTLCHELAHLRYFHHGVTFQAYYRRLLEWARARGIYRPRGAPETEVACQPPVSGEALRETLARLRDVVEGAGHEATSTPAEAAPRLEATPPSRGTTSSEATPSSDAAGAEHGEQLRLFGDGA